MNFKYAMFTTKDDIYYPANKNAIAECAKLSKMRLRKGDMLLVQKSGYIPILTNGQPIMAVNITA